jgi:hypothetical protein
MRDKLSTSMTMVASVATAVGIIVSASTTPAPAQVLPSAAATATASPLRTPWGEPDLQGIWTDETDTPLQRPPKFAHQEFFTDAERADLDRQRSASLGRDKRSARGSEADVAGAYNAIFTPKKRTGLRTSRIVDPPDGRLPALTPEARKLAAADREFRLALLRATDTCKNKERDCSGGTYDPTPSPRFEETPPRYNTVRLNRHYGPEDANLAERCLMGGLPEAGPIGAIGDRISFRRIVQTPGGVTMFYDVGQGQGWQRNIVMNGSPHLPGGIRQWYGDSRGHWEGDTLVVDTINFRRETSLPNSSANTRLVERFTRADANTLVYEFTVEDPSVWTRPWTAVVPMRKSDQPIYEYACHEGNYAMAGILAGARAAEKTATAAGRRAE